ncbi:MAG: hypothetical protein AMS24_03880 [Chlamydiae bacterium SM23_39]|nr:MAG: hypothetical protein AMS24_03880 [Chlamydiae bacterium SM23_39]
MIKKIFIICITIFFVFFVAKGWHILTGGFRTNKILPPKDCECFKKETPESLKKDFFKIFNQNYHFLDKGCQVYVFESEDKKYVIKFLRYHKYQPPFWINFLDFFKRGKIYKNNVVDYKKFRIKTAHNSYLMAFNDWGYRTAIIYMHLGRTDHIKRKLKVKDRLGQYWHIDLDKMHYIVQRRVEKLSFTLMECVRDKDLDRAKILIDEYFEVMRDRCLKGIKNVDHSGYIRNMGHIDNFIFEIDVGGYRKKDIIKTKKGMEKEFEHFTRRLKRWAEKRAPFLYDYIDNRSKIVLEKSFKDKG